MGKPPAACRPLFDVPAVAAGAAVERLNFDASSTRHCLHRLHQSAFFAGSFVAVRSVVSRISIIDHSRFVFIKERLLMKFARMSRVAFSALVLSICLRGVADAQLPPIVINEIVEDEQDFESTDVADTREFVELYNPTNSPVLIENWTLSVSDLIGGAPISDTFPQGATIPAKGYYVIGAAGVPNVNFTPLSGELWINGKSIFELRNAGGQMVDAVALETFRGNELAMATQEQLDQIAAGQTAGANPRGGWWGQVESNNAIAPNVPMSLGRFLDGRDNNINGRDFGMLPITPGASNNLPQNPSHVIPDVNSSAVGTLLGSQYYASFKLPRVINPAVADVYNPKAISASPQGGNAIVAWDETGGGNAVYSRELVNKFELYAYIETAPLNVTSSTTVRQSEATIYGLGTTDVFFATPNSTGLSTITSSANGSTGVGWLIERLENFNGGSPTTTTTLQLVDFSDGGDGVQAAGDWNVIQSINLSSMASGWHRLSVDYNATTGAVEAKFDAQTFNFTTDASLVGNFYVGYRETLPGTGGTIARPPTFDLVPAAPAEDADFNNDNVVDGADFLIWQRGFGAAGANQNGDADGNGQVNAADLAIWKAKFGSASASAAVGAVPEPASIAVAAAGLLLALPAFRRRSASRALWK
jgi:hypothetical protein